jgi:cobaltochelatase CobT
LRHIIYKSADSPWRQSKKNIGLMLKEGILKKISMEKQLNGPSTELRKGKKKEKLLWLFQTELQLMIRLYPQIQEII